MEKQLLLNVSLIEEEEGGYSAIATDLDIASQGETVDEALANLKEAVELYIESAEELGVIEEILEKLGFSSESIKDKNFLVPPVFRTEIPINLKLQ